MSPRYWYNEYRDTRKEFLEEEGFADAVSEVMRLEELIIRAHETANLDLIADEYEKIKDSLEEM